MTGEPISLGSFLLIELSSDYCFFLMEMLFYKLF